MKASDALSMTRKMINENGQVASIRRWTGTGPTRTKVDTATMAFVRNYSSKELIGSVVQGDQVAVMLIDSLSGILPLRTTDFLLIGTATYSIKNIMPREVAGVLVAVELHVSGGVSG